MVALPEVGWPETALAELFEHGPPMRGPGPRRGATWSTSIRVEWLERELAGTRALLRAVLERLEKHLGEDIDRDGRIG